MAEAVPKHNFVTKFFELAKMDSLKTDEKDDLLYDPAISQEKRADNRGVWYKILERFIQKTLGSDIPVKTLILESNRKREIQNILQQIPINSKSPNPCNTTRSGKNRLLQCSRKCGNDEGLVYFVAQRVTALRNLEQAVGAPPSLDLFLDRCPTRDHATVSQMYYLKGPTIEDPKKLIAFKLDDIASALKKIAEDLEKEGSAHSEPLRQAAFATQQLSASVTPASEASPP